MAGWGASERTLVQLLVRDVFGGHVHITSWERIEPWFVVRCELEGAGVPSVIVKSLREHPTGFRTDPAQVVTERCALEFVAAILPGFAPRLLAADTDAGVLVLEDLAPRVPLWDLLASGASGAESGLTAFAKAFGELAARTAGLSDVYYAARGALGPIDPMADRVRVLSWGWNDVVEFTAAMGASIPSAATREMDDVFARITDPGPFLAFTNGDAGANNYLVRGDGSDGRLIDYEFAGFRHALRAASALYVPGSMWMTVGDPIAEGHEDVYRSALAIGIPEAADDVLYGAGLASACVAFTAVDRMHRLETCDAREPGHHSRVQMLATIEATVRTAEAHRSLPHICGWLRAVDEALRRRWPDADIDIASLGRYATRE